MELIKDTTKVGFIGIGVMGSSMARNLMQGGYGLHLYTRTKQRAQELITAGAIWENSVAELAARCDVVFTIVGFPPDVKEVYLGEEGLLAHMKPGSFVVDMTTSRPDLAVTIAQRAAEKNIQSFDAPVSGGDIGAREAKLSIMVGGPQQYYATILPLLHLMGKNIVYQGGPGSGQHTKMCNQIAIASNMMGLCEAIAYAEQSGLDPETVMKSIESGAAGSWSLSNLGPRIIGGDLEPGFYVKHFIKDMSIALEAADEMGLTMPGLAQAKLLYEQLADSGAENKGTQALITLYRSGTKSSNK